MAKKNNKVPSYTKESKESRRERVSSGISFRPTVFKDKSKYTRKQKHKGGKDND